MGPAIKRAKFLELEFAYTFGITSPNIKIKKVMTITLNRNSKRWLPEKSKSPSVIKADNITIPTLMKLLAISILANSDLGWSISFMRVCDFLFSSSPNSSKSVGVKEKKATSDPETKADRASNTQSNNRGKMSDRSKSLIKERKTILGGSGSKSMGFG